MSREQQTIRTFVLLSKIFLTTFQDKLSIHCTSSRAKIITSACLVDLINTSAMKATISSSSGAFLTEAIFKFELPSKWCPTIPKNPSGAFNSSQISCRRLITDVVSQSFVDMLEKDLLSQPLPKSELVPLEAKLASSSIGFSLKTSRKIERKTLNGTRVSHSQHTFLVIIGLFFFKNNSFRTRTIVCTTNELFPAPDSPHKKNILDLHSARDISTARLQTVSISFLRPTYLALTFPHRVSFAVKGLKTGTRST
mmetsp:Transcript_18099/g.27461  ORF Transcript_18099/g.27461 Transcript_18099/m.27461 type:complete len:253 (-) Transcript_18099:1959-2717(-)